MDIESTLSALRESGNLRRVPADSRASAAVDLSGNDYLGLAVRDDLRREFMAEACERGYAMSASASRLLASHQSEFDALERCIAQAYRRPALLFNSGYHANTGMIAALTADKRTLVVADRLVHASIIDGIRLGGAPMERFRHNDYGHLRRILAAKAKDYAGVLIVAESIYSMDGDRADLEKLLELKRLYPNVMLYVDEAHAFGVLGPKGLGVSAGCSDPSQVDIIVGTFGKAVASMGAFAITSRDMHDYLVNTSRSFIFSTALPPMSAAWTRFTLGYLIRKDNRRQHLQRLGEQLKGVLEKYTDHQIVASHIQPLIVGDPKKAVELSRQLLSRYGIKALPIRRPTVPAGTERLRFSLSANMIPRDIEALDSALYDLM